MRDFQLPGRSPVFAVNGMCATSHPLAAQVAVSVLQAGGNAVDAAVAAAILLGFAEPQMCGIGGDCFALLKPADEDRVIGLNGSGRAPGGLDAAAMRARGWAVMPTEGVETVTLPGAVDALCRLSVDWGRMPLAEVLAPAIRHARDGVPVAPRVAFDWASDGARLSGAARDFYLDGGQPPAVGTLFRALGQAEVLERVAAQGRAGFYEGEVAEDMIASLRALGGPHTLDDLAATESVYTDPIAGSYGGHELIEHPPNGQGAAAILMLKILSHFDLGSLDPMGADRAHLEAEAWKLAQDARDRFVADPAHTARLGHMLSDATAQGLAALIDPARAMPAPPPGAEAVHRDTVYVTVVDRDRMAVSLIHSIYWGFGAGLASSKFGILFQNRGAGFSLIPGHPNEAAGGKRPMHTIIPAMLAREGRVIMPFGVMGGSFQPAGHARFVSNMVDYGMDPQAAADAPRSFVRDGVLEMERGYPDAVRAAMAAKGHRVVTAEKPLGGAQAILIDASGVLEGGSDPRKDGVALGY